MSNIVPINSKVPAALRDMQASVNDDLTSGLSGGFGVLSIKGSKFRIKYGGETELVTNEDGDPKMSLEVILLKSNPAVSKTYYEGGYAEGSTDEPDCFSLDGIKPSSRAPNPQSKLCAACPMGKWGSKISDEGVESKACSDYRRVAVVPAGDIENEQYGGAMLLRVPATSLGDLAQYGRAMKAKGFPYNTVVTRLSFDPDVSYPKLRFKAARPVSDEDAVLIIDHLQGEGSEKLESVLFEAREVTAATAGDIAGVEDKPKAKPKAKPKPPAAVDTDFDDEDEDEPAPKPKAKAKPKPKPKPKPKAKPEAEEDTETSALDDELDDVFAAMDSEG